MTLFLHDKKPKKGMLQAAKEQGFEDAMQRVDALEIEVIRLRAALDEQDEVALAWTKLTDSQEGEIDRLRAALEAMLDEFGEFAMPSVRIARAALEETK